MNGECERVRDVLPDWLGGTLGRRDQMSVGAHLSACEDCAREEAVLRTLLAARVDAPPGLEARIQARLRAELAAPHRDSRTDGKVIPFRSPWRWAPTWALSAAAVVVLSLGIGVIWNGEEVPEVGQDPVQVVAEEPLPEAWLWDDGMVAGAPVYDGLTDEQLEALIEELEG